MRLRFMVDVELTKASGKFASKAEAIEAVQEALEGADESSWSLGDSEYETAEWSVSEA
jgi:hypothetical protein